jgi:hypothetical protein
MTAVEIVLGKLENVTKTGTGWTAKCPSHHDRHASLSVGTGADGRVLLRCFAGCTPDAIVGALQLELRDLFERDDAAPAAPPKRPKLRVTDLQVKQWNADLLGSPKALIRLEQLRGWTWPAISHAGVGLHDGKITFPYRNATGKLTGLGRYAPNPATRDDGPKTKAETGSKRDLFPGPERMPTGDRWLFVVEGEPDQLRLFSCGVHAVAVPGVQGWRQEWAERFRGRRVCIAFDCDAAGREAAQRVAGDLPRCCRRRSRPRARRYPP